MTGAVDLFGVPIPDPRRAGRPRHVPTGESKRKVKELAKRGFTHEEIARMVGISHPTLARHYSAILGEWSPVTRKRQGAAVARGHLALFTKVHP